MLHLTSFLIALNCLIYFLVNFVSQNGELNLTLGLNLMFLQGYFWQPLTLMFMHANLTHIAMNMAVLYQFGGMLERYFGIVKFAILYLLGGLATSLLSFVYIYYSFISSGGSVQKYMGHTIFVGSNEFINLVGASGAISVLLGVLAFLDKSKTKGIFIAVLLMSFLPLLMGVNVAWYAHLIGFGVGYFMLRFKLI